MAEELIVDPASEAVLVPLDQWPTVEPEPMPEVSAARLEADKKAMDEYWALEAEVRAYAQAVGDATAGMGEAEVNAYCRELEAWNDAVAGEPRHAEPT